MILRMSAPVSKSHPLNAPADADPAGAVADRALPGAWLALSLLLAINLFNYIDRQVLAAVEPLIGKDVHASDVAMGWTATAFMVSYMVLSPLFGFLGDRYSRWKLIAIGVALWSLASGATGLASGFGILIATRCCVGVGEAAYGPVAPTLLADFFPAARRGSIMSLFYLAIPVGSALGYMLGGAIAHWLSWRWAFYLVVPPGMVLAGMAMLMKDPPRGQADAAAAHTPALADYQQLLKNKSYLLCTAGMTAMAFSVGGIAFWMPKYILQQAPYSLDKFPDASLAKINLIFGAIVVVAGLSATLAGGWAGDLLRKRYSGAYFVVSGIGLIVGMPLLLLALYMPFPMAWIFLAASCFCLFFNTGPTNAILANVTHPSIRAAAFAANIFIIHLLGDALSPIAIGAISTEFSLRSAFAAVSVLMLIGGLLWLWGAIYLEADHRAAGGDGQASSG